MKAGLTSVRRLYGFLLNLFPRNYRHEYGEEVQTVFDLSLEEASKNGRLEVANILLRELTSLPGAILYEHLREWRRNTMTEKFASRFDFEPGSRTETFAALAPFLLGMVMVFIGYLGRYLTIPLWIQIAFVILFWSATLGLFLLGSAKGLPRWFLPYLGLPLPIASLLLFNSLVEMWGGAWWNRLPGLLSAFTLEGLLWMGMILLLLLLLVIMRWVPGFHPFYQRLKSDWTLLSFLLYGAVPLTLWVTFDGYVNDEPFFFLSLLMLALGGWFYLRSDAPLKRFASLQIGLALSMLTATAGKAVLFMGSWFQVFDSTWKDELLPTLMTWIWLALIMLLPLAINLLPQSDNHLQTEAR